MGREGSGASAAVAGLVAVFLVLSIENLTRSPQARIRLGLAIILATGWLAAGFILNEIELPFFGRMNIANDVHVFGFIVGLIMGTVLLASRTNTPVGKSEL